CVARRGLGEPRATWGADGRSRAPDWRARSGRGGAFARPTERAARPPSQAQALQCAGRPGVLDRGLAPPRGRGSSRGTRGGRSHGHVAGRRPADITTAARIYVPGRTAVSLSGAARQRRQRPVPQQDLVEVVVRRIEEIGAADAEASATPTAA